MHRAGGDDEALPRAKNYLSAVLKLDAEFTCYNQKQLVLIWMEMPAVLAIEHR